MEKELEQKVDDALRLFGMCQKQVAVLNVDCQKMMKDLKEVVDSMEGRFAVQDSSMEVKKLEVEEVSLKVNKRLDKDKKDILDRDHSKSEKIKQDLASFKACFLNIFEFLPSVRPEAPSQNERDALKEQINILGK